MMRSYRSQSPCATKSAIFSAIAPGHDEYFERARRVTLEAMEAALQHVGEGNSVTDELFGLYPTFAQQANGTREVFVDQVTERANDLLLGRDERKEVEGRRTRRNANLDDTAAAASGVDSHGPGGRSPRRLDHHIWANAGQVAQYLRRVRLFRVDDTACAELQRKVATARVRLDDEDRRGAGAARRLQSKESNGPAAED